MVGRSFRGASTHRKIAGSLIRLRFVKIAYILTIPKLNCIKYIRRTKIAIAIIPFTLNPKWRRIIELRLLTFNFPGTSYNSLSKIARKYPPLHIPPCFRGMKSPPGMGVATGETFCNFGKY